jgi:prevent-host-death family protein
MLTVNMHDAKSQLSRLVEAVASGTESVVIIARNGKPAAKLVPVGDTVDVSKRIGGGLAACGPLKSMSLDELNAADAEIASFFYGDGE